LDEKLLRELAPTLIVAQDLCQVCAPSGHDITRVLRSLQPTPQVLWFNPKSISGIEENVRELGKATGHSRAAEAVIGSGRARLQKVAKALAKAGSRPRVFCMEWADPIYCSGHWVPEMVELAGGTDGLGRKGTDSVRIEWKTVVEWTPEVFIISPCGFNLSAALGQSAQLSQYPGWEDLPAVRQGRVYAVDANSYFARPGPRVFEGVELLAHLLHPDLYQWSGPEAFARV
jgi:iron complex transport system substrate-binding protein